LDNYKLTIYKTESDSNILKQKNLTWIELVDMKKQASHIFSFAPGDHYGMFGGCGFFRKKKRMPDNVHSTVDISLTESAYIEMLKEGYGLHKRFLIYDDCLDLPASKFN